MTNQVMLQTKNTGHTAEQILQRFRDDGQIIKVWAFERGFSPALVYAVLQGKRKCLRGVELRLKLTHLPQ